MSEARSISQLTTEKADKTNPGDWYLVVERLNISGVPDTRKILLQTLLAGVLFPDGFGDIDVDNNNLLNVGDIFAGNLDLSGSAEFNGNAKNKTNPYINFSIDNGAGAAGTTSTTLDNHIIGQLTTESSPPAGETGKYFEIPNNKCDQLFRLAYNAVATNSFVLRFYRYTRTTSTYQNFTDFTVGVDANPNELIIPTAWNITQGTFTSDDDIRVFVEINSGNVLMNIGQFWALQ